MMEGSLSVICSVSFMFMVIQCLVNGQDTDGFLSTNTTWSLSNESTMVGSLTLDNEGNSSAILITHIVHQSFEARINSWSFLSFVEKGDSEYVLSIVVSGSFKQEKGEVVWAANGDKPVSQNGILELQSDGNLVLSDSINGDSSASDRRRTIWTTNTAGKGVTGMRLFGGGVLQIVGEANSTLWQSSDNPTDTLLLGQFLRVGYRLVSRTSRYNMSQGIYSLQVRPGGLGLYVKGSDTASSELYWMWNVYNKSALALDQNCPAISFNVSIAWPDSSLGLKFLNSSTTSSASTTCDISSFTPNYYLSPAVKAQPNLSSDAVYIRVDYDGNLRGYAAGAAEPFQLLSEAMSKCQLPSSCGNYGVCSQHDQQCKCPNNGTHHIGRSESNSSGPGCELSQKPSCANVNGSWEMFSVAGMEYNRNRYAVPLNMSTMEKCSDYCLNNCSCIASFYVNESRSCFVVSSQLGTLADTSNESNFVFIKVKSIDIIRNPEASKHGRNFYKVLIIGVGAGLIAAAVVLIFLHPFTVCRRSEPEPGNSGSEHLGGAMCSMRDVLMARKFSFKEIRKLTNNFRKVLGSGGFGTVYEGVLQDGTMVAVKRLDIARQGEKEFHSEVAILGIIHHWNLVQLLGFCAQGSHKILVYEHMPNGSLDRWLFDESKISFLTWPIRFNIVLGTARGLAYLHQECRYKIIHLDVKPQNILLDENFVAKVSDFGMATLMSRKDSGVVTTMRGTPGYLAPEWLLECAITEKSDVYSFGMVVLEIIGGRKNYNKWDESDKSYFPAWALSMAVVGRETEVIDSRLAGDYDLDREQTIRVLKISFLCIQEDAHRRPSMRTVVQMLEGEQEVPDLPLHENFQFTMAKRKNPMSRLLPAGNNSVNANSSMQYLSAR